MVYCRRRRPPRLSVRTTRRHVASNATHPCWARASPAKTSGRGLTLSTVSLIATLTLTLTLTHTPNTHHSPSCSSHRRRQLLHDVSSSLVTRLALAPLPPLAATRWHRHSHFLAAPLRSAPASPWSLLCHTAAASGVLLAASSFSTISVMLAASSCQRPVLTTERLFDASTSPTPRQGDTPPGFLQCRLERDPLRCC